VASNYATDGTSHLDTQRHADFSGGLDTEARRNRLAWCLAPQADQYTDGVLEDPVPREFHHAIVKSKNDGAPEKLKTQGQRQVAFSKRDW